MKNLILISFLVFAAQNFFSQIVVQGISPNSVQGNFNFTWADPASGWATPDFNIPGNFVQDTLMIVNDGSVGFNAQGNPISAEGCNPLINDLTGKIAVIYRNTCEFSLKVWNAQNAGAVGVIIINREPGVTTMGSGVYGASVNIPVVMLSLSDGQSLVSEMQNGSVVVLMGNISNFYSNNLGLKKQNILAPKRAMTPLSIAQNGNEYNFQVGGYVHNFGNQAQANITLNSQIINPAGAIIYNENVVIPFLASGDSALADPTIFPLFQPSSYTLGDYYLTYTVSSGNTEEASDDNTLSYKFSITNDIFSYAKSNSTSGLPTSQNHYGNSQGSISICQTINDPNASRLLADGLYFSASMQAPNSLIGEQIYLNFYQWDDQFTDISDPNFSFNSLNSIASGVYTYGSNLQNQSVYAPFNNSVQLVDNQRYLACAQTYSQNVNLGFDNVDYTFNTNYYLQPLTPLEYSGTFYSLGFGSDSPNSLGVKVSACPNLVVNALNITECTSYTSPYTGQVYNQSGQYEEVLSYVNGCDSVLYQINLTISAEGYLGTSAQVIQPSCGVQGDGSVNLSVNLSTVVGDYFLISEYYNGLGQNKVLEIYNLTQNPIDLGADYGDPSANYTIFFNLRNASNQVFTFPQNTIIPPNGTLLIANPNSTLQSNITTPVIDGSQITMYWYSAEYNYEEIWDVATPSINQTMKRKPSVNINNPVYNSNEWNFGVLPSNTLGYHYYNPNDYQVQWSNGFIGNSIANLPVGTYEYVLVHQPSGCIVETDSVVLTGQQLTNYIYAQICNGESYIWNSVQYNQSGIYNQSFVSQFGCDSIVTLELNVIPNNFGSSFSSSSQLLTSPPFAVQFFNNTPNLSQYNFTWYFGDGTSLSSNNASVFHQYNFNGSYDVTLVATNILTGCQESYIQTDYIFCTGGPSCSQSAIIAQNSPLNGCQGSTNILSCNSGNGFSYIWTKNGINIPNSNNDTILVTESGTYNVFVSVNGCSVQSNSVAVNIQNNPTAPVITSDGPLVFCQGDSVTLFSNSQVGLNYQWQLNNTNIPNELSPNLLVTESGLYNLVVTNSNGCSAVSSSTLISVNPNTIPAFTEIGTICSGDNFSLPTSSINSTPINGTWSPTINNTVTTTYTFTPNSGQCASSVNMTVNVISTPISPTFTQLSPVCNGDAISLQFVSNEGISGGWSPALNNTQTTTYTFTPALGQCATSQTMTVVVNELPSVTLSSFGSVCDTLGSFVLTGGSPVGGIYVGDSIVNNVFSSSLAGVYPIEYTYTDDNGCSASSVQNLTVISCSGSSISELTKLNLMIYPNPVFSVFTIESSPEFKGKTYVIRDIRGRSILNGTFSDSIMNLDISLLSVGAYYFDVPETNHTLMIIKQ